MAGITVASPSVMPRKPLIYTNHLPYHITARTNNKEWFKIPIHKIWNVFVEELNYLNKKRNFETHVFTLMNNHYHLIGSCSETHSLGDVMRDFQSRTARTINSLSGRINHVYGKRYRASLIGDEFYYATAIKYVLRNPVTAGICKNVESWPYSNLNELQGCDDQNILTTNHIFAKPMWKLQPDILPWLNQNFDDHHYNKIKLGLTRAEFKIRGRSSPLQELL